MMNKFVNSLVILFVIFGIQNVFAADPMKISYVYVSPIGDAGWTFQHDKGRIAVEKEFGDKVKVNFVESVGEGPDAERVIRNLAARGSKLIFATSFGYMNPTLKVAKRFPKVVFEHATGYKKSRNVGNYLPRFYEGRYLVGMIAGKMTKSNVIGYVAAFPIPEVVRGINSFTLGIRSVNPKATVKVIWTSSWFDPGKEREAAETLAAQGADVLTHHTDSTAVVQTANDRGIYAIAYHSDMSKHGKKAHLAAVVHNWEKFYIQRVYQVIAGTWKSSSIWNGIKEGMIDLEGLSSDLPSDVKSMVTRKKYAIADGSFHPFQGPFNNQSGKQVVAAGQQLDDGALLGMNYYVEGVMGSLPK
ncbi:MAG: BMP family ABC transporter substrate-binding protein [Proteobacteria bacterium]|nr:BMP family ABC transporter substrate-binding protein [Pseudomonadota bacterium]